ncbi:S-glutathionyl-(chloro)hydroquinone reductase [Boothiomyces macroporosus]|uniref:S-glutathionyl-(Chloro)hydroquinone reductase n=1 Tax=Boothiomyces macroporosus TaxID=261099 RepID=A0AAD5US06_9FUNG|nr:S-glutathionyl-(chloro)hydroquinone reductase [Boothiomyces macroporosus]
MTTQLPSILKWASEDGEFKRQVSSFRNIIKKGSQYPPAANRYHLYVSLACPWAHRTLIVRKLKGLESIIGVSVVHYYMGENGWKFSDPSVTRGATLDTVNGAEYLRELYLKTPEYTGRFTVPVLWDKETSTIVNNESSEIIRMFNSEFDEWSSNPGVTYYPDSLKDQIDEINTWIYDTINNGVYKSGFATTQQAYSKNVNQLFVSLDRVEDILSKNKFLVGNTFTEADIRLFTTIVRFDPVYHTHFKCNQKTISDSYPHILKWARTIYQMPGIAETVDMEHIKKHYYLSHKQINPYQIVPEWNGPDLSLKA